MRSTRLASSSSVPVAQLHQLLPLADEKALSFAGWWQRMHQGRAPLVTAALKFVEWAEDGAAPGRFVWEVCQWPHHRSPAWTFVCWMIDGEGMWMKSFASRTEALAYFAQEPAAVMPPSAKSAVDSPIRGVRLRRAS